MSAPECTCAIVWDAFKQAEVIRKCALCRASAQMYEALNALGSYTYATHNPGVLPPSYREGQQALEAARGETERVR